MELFDEQIQREDDILRAAGIGTGRFSVYEGLVGIAYLLGKDLAAVEELQPHGLTCAEPDGSRWGDYLCHPDPSDRELVPFTATELPVGLRRKLLIKQLIGNIKMRREWHREQIERAQYADHLRALSARRREEYERAAEKHRERMRQAEHERKVVLEWRSAVNEEAQLLYRFLCGLELGRWYVSSEFDDPVRAADLIDTCRQLELVEVDEYGGTVWFRTLNRWWGGRIKDRLLEIRPQPTFG